MPNLIGLLNEKFRKVARREVKEFIKVSKRAAMRHRRDIAELKREIAALAKQMTAHGAAGGGSAAAAPSAEGSAVPRRFSPAGIKKHRLRLELSAKDFGRLVGVSGLTIYNWETGKARPRQRQLDAIAGIRGIGKREASQRLA